MQKPSISPRLFGQCTLNISLPSFPLQHLPVVASSSSFPSPLPFQLLAWQLRSLPLRFCLFVLGNVYIFVANVFGSCRFRSFTSKRSSPTNRCKRFDVNTAKRYCTRRLVVSTCRHGNFNGVARVPRCSTYARALRYKLRPRLPVAFLISFMLILLRRCCLSMSEDVCWSACWPLCPEL